MLFFSSYVALPPFDVALEDFALEEDFFVEELDETFLLDEEFALLLLDFFHSTAGHRFF